MSAEFKPLFTSRLYRLLAQWVILPWGLQGVAPSGAALEIGSGGGAMAARLLRRFHTLRLVATDVDAEMVAATGEQLRRFGERASAVEADATRLPFADGSFDTVFCFAVLHHTGDWAAALGESLRVLRPGGRLVGYDMLEGSPLHGAGRRGAMHVVYVAAPKGGAAAETPRHRGGLLRPGDLESFFREHPVAQARIQLAPHGIAVRFLVTKAA